LPSEVDSESRLGLSLKFSPWGRW